MFMMRAEELINERRNKLGSIRDAAIRAIQENEAEQAKWSREGGALLLSVEMGTGDKAEVNARRKTLEAKAKAAKDADLQRGAAGAALEKLALCGGALIPLREAKAKLWTLNKQIKGRGKHINGKPVTGTRPKIEAAKLFRDVCRALEVVNQQFRQNGLEMDEEVKAEFLEEQRAMAEYIIGTTYEDYVVNEINIPEGRGKELGITWALA